MEILKIRKEGASLVAQWVVPMHGYNPWLEKIPHAKEQLSPCTTAEPVLQSPGAATAEALSPWSLCSTTTEATSTRSLLTTTREEPPLPTTREKPAQL